MTDFLPIISNLWNISPHDSRERHKCIHLYKQLNLLLKKTDDNHRILKTMLKTRDCDHILESRNMPYLRYELIKTIRNHNSPVEYIQNSLQPWKKTIHKEVDMILVENMYICEYIVYRIGG